eukprot:gene12819-11695_t
MLGASCTRCQQLGGGRMLAVAVAVLATFTFPRLARGAKDDMMRVSWSPQAADCQQDTTGLKAYLNSDYYYRGETVDGKGYYSRNVDSATLNGKPYEMRHSAIRRNRLALAVGLLLAAGLISNLTLLGVIL